MEFSKNRVPTETGNGYEKVMENWPKVMEFCDQSWNFTNFAPKLY